MQLKDLVNTIDSSVRGTLRGSVLALSYDSRQVKKNSVYFAIKGTQTDGHLYIAQAINAGAIACVVEQTWLDEHSDLSSDITWIGVHNTAQAMADLAHVFSNKPSHHLKMIGVTGTNGKTTVTHLIQALLEPDLSCGKIGTLGNHFRDWSQTTEYTTPFSPEMQTTLKKMLELGAQAVTLECSSHALEQRRLDAIEMDLAVFTNLTQDHLDYHQTMSAYSNSKQLLFSRLLLPSGVALINRDDPYASDFIESAQACAQILTYSQFQPADLQAQNIQYSINGSRFQLSFKGNHYAVSLQMPGSFNVLNALAALGVAFTLDIEPPLAIERLAQVQGVAGRLEVVSSKEAPFSVIVDYAHTPDSLKNVLKTARDFTKGQVISVFGCGGDRDKTKRPLMALAAEAWSDHIVLTTDNPRSEEPEAIIKDILMGFKDTHSVRVSLDRAGAIAKAISLAQAGDVVVIAGKGHETYQIFKDQTLHFDDREVAKAALERLRVCR